MEKYGSKYLKKTYYLKMKILSSSQPQKPNKGHNEGNLKFIKQF